MEHKSDAGQEPAPNPRPVTRGLKLQVGHFGLDSLYLVVEYPSADLYHNWADLLDKIDNPNLHEGVTVDDMVIRKGALGYKLAVWDGDARIFLTNQVEDSLLARERSGQGMGVMLQLGPKWLARFGDVVATNQMIENIHAQLAVFGMRKPEDYRIRLNRIDIALDVLGLSVADFSIDEWRRQWVGYASPTSTYFNAQTRALETITIGSSKGNVRFKVYDKVAESIKQGNSTFWRSVWGLAEDEETPVTRFEWTIRAYGARFTRMRYLDDFTFLAFCKLLNYVTHKWGRLCIPQANDTNRTRWPLAPLWADIQAFVEDWNINYTEFAKRDYDFTPDLNDKYLNSLAGWIAGAQARFGLCNQGEAIHISELFPHMRERGYSPEALQHKADRKFRRWRALSGIPPKGDSSDE